MESASAHPTKINLQSRLEKTKSQKSGATASSATDFMTPSPNKNGRFLRKRSVVTSDNHNNAAATSQAYNNILGRQTMTATERKKTESGASQ